MNLFVRRHALTTFFILAYALTWLGALPYLFGVLPVPMIPFGPLLAALIVTSMSGGWAATNALLLRMLQWRVAPRWYAVALLVPLGITAVAVYGNILYGAPTPSADVILGKLPSVVPIFAVALLSPFSGAMGEEPGWRGFALPRLLATRSPLATSLILGVLVAGWHSPLFVSGLYGQVPLRILFIVATTVLFTLISSGSGGSVLLAMLFHASLNAAPEFAFAAFSGADLDRAITLYSLAGVAASIVAAIIAWPRFAQHHGSRAPLAATPVTARSLP